MTVGRTVFYRELLDMLNIFPCKLMIDFAYYIKLYVGEFERK